MQTEVATVEQITELDLIVTREPTNVWLLRDDADVDSLKCYEQWEQGRPFKAKAVYHHPDGDNFYLKNVDDPFGVNIHDTMEPYTPDELSLAPERPGKRHQVKDGEDIYSIGLHYKVPWQDILAHNELDGASLVRPGVWLYIPPQVTTRNRKDIEYRLLDEPRPMHVARPGGTTKFSFGAVKKWADIRADLKHYGDGQNVDIVAIAKVPVEDTVAAYYMDRHDLGDYKNTSRPTYTRGFNWQHLAEGHIAPEERKARVEEVVAAAMLEEDRPSLPATQEIAPTPVAVEDEPEAPVDEPVVSPLERELDDYKATFRHLNIEESPERFRLLEDVEIRELDGALPARPMKADSSVMVSGWFFHKGTPYYRVATRYWYALPTHLAYSVEDEPFNNFTVNLKDRITYGGALTREEQRVATLAKVAARYNRIKTVSGLLRRR